MSVVELLTMLVRPGIRLSPSTDKVAPAETRWMNVPCCGVVEEVLVPCRGLVVISLGPCEVALSGGAAGAVVEGAGVSGLVDSGGGALAAVVVRRLQNGQGIEIPLG